MSYINIKESTLLIINISNHLANESDNRAFRVITEQLTQQNYDLAFVNGIANSLATVRSEAGFCGVLINASTLDRNDTLIDFEQIKQIILEIRKRDANVPITLTADRERLHELPLEIINEVHEYFQIGEDTPDFIAGRIAFSAKRYSKNLLPPYFKALKSYAEDHPYYWDCPGHQGGVAYLKHPVGRSFLRFFGENIMRADIGIATPELGDWLEHMGPPGESEKRASKIFGADKTYYVTGGSSQSNQIVGHGVLQKDQLVLVDRNCHKSVNHELTVTGARPIYFKPTRNGFGIIGLIPPEQFNQEAINAAINKSPLTKEAKDQKIAYTVVTNCTYDGSSTMLIMSHQS